MLKDTDPEDDYAKLIKIVLDAALVDYIKLQHPLNRNKKYLEEALETSVQLFFDKDFRFEHFYDRENPNQKYSLIDVMMLLTNTRKISMQKIQQHVVDESISYWWEKNFHDIKIPQNIVLAGKVFKIINAPKLEKIDYENNTLSFPVKKTGSDRVFFKLCFQVILKESEIQLSDDQFEKIYKIFYLFLKINDAFPAQKKKEKTDELD